MNQGFQCTTCHIPFPNQQYAMHTDQGLQCDGCFHEGELEKTWQKGFGIAISSMLSPFFFSLIWNPYSVVACACFLACARGLHLALSKKEDTNGFSFSLPKRIALLSVSISVILLTIYIHFGRSILSLLDITLTPIAPLSF